MPELRRVYRVNSMDPQELNRVLAYISDRMDELEGYRGKGDFKTIPSSAQSASDPTDLARYSDVIEYADSASIEAAEGIFGATLITISGNTLKIYDAAGLIVLHGFGDLI